MRLFIIQTLLFHNYEKTLSHVSLKDQQLNKQSFVHVLYQLGISGNHHSEIQHAQKLMLELMLWQIL
jgi:hypothetical protein